MEYNPYVLRHKVARYLFPFISNCEYNNRNYYNELIKEYGKKNVVKIIKELERNGTISDAFRKA